MVRKYINKAKEKGKHLSKHAGKHIHRAKSHTLNSARTAHSHASRHASALSLKFREHIATALVAAFGFVIALSWRDVITKGIESIKDAPFLVNNPGLIPLYTAIITTAIAAIGILFVTRWMKKPEEPTENKK
jgi:hypothetical protein